MLGSRRCYSGLHGHHSHYYLRVYIIPGEGVACKQRLVVLATECRDNRGTSITNCAEELAGHVWEELGCPPGLVWIESHEDSFLEESFTALLTGWFRRVDFAVTPWTGGSHFSEPTWVPVIRSEVEALVGQPLPIVLQPPFA